VGRGSDDGIGVEARREMAAEIGRYFGVPTRILNAPAGDSETYSNVENDRDLLLRYTLRGYMGPIEDAISERLPGDYLGAAGWSSIRAASCRATSRPGRPHGTR
jgi:phage portal protein BeeE